MRGKMFTIDQIVRVIRNSLMLVLMCFSASIALAQSTLDSFNRKLKIDGLRPAISFLSERIKEKDPVALRIYAALLVTGKGVAQDIPKGIELLKYAVELGDAPSADTLGNFFSDGKFISPDLSLAIKYYERAISLGSSAAKQKLNALQKNERKKLEREPKSTVVPTPKLAPVPSSTNFPGVSSKSIEWQGTKIDLYKVRSFGSAAAISDNGLFYTNEHVINGCKRVFVRYQDRFKEGKVTFKREKQDIALIRINENTPSFLTLKIGPPLLGESLISGGYPAPDTLGFSIKITTGVVSSEIDPRDNMFQHTTPTQKGNSGGPLVDQYGQLVGLSTAVYAKKIGGLNPQNINFAASNLAMIEGLKSQGLRPKTFKPTESLATSELAVRLKRSAGQVLCY